MSDRWLKLKGIAWVGMTAACLQGCGSSALSDVELADASLVTPNFSVIQGYQANGSSGSLIYASFQDKNGFAVRLKNAAVVVNGLEMKAGTDPISDRPYYFSNATVNPGTDYEFTVTLSNGNKYKARVKTPEKQLTAFDLPAEHAMGKSLALTWKDTVTAAEVLMDFDKDTAFHWSNGFLSAYAYEKVWEVAEGDMGRAGTAVPDTFFAGLIPGPRQVKLMAINSGSVDPGFRSGGRARAGFCIFRKFRLKTAE